MEACQEVPGVVELWILLLSILYSTPLSLAILAEVACLPGWLELSPHL